MNNTTIFSILTAVCVTGILGFLLFGKSTKPSVDSRAAYHSTTSDEPKRSRIEATPIPVSAAPLTRIVPRDEPVKPVKAQPEIVVPRTKPADVATNVAPAKALAETVADVRAAELRARAEREAQIDRELQDERVHGPKQDAPGAVAAATVAPVKTTVAVLPVRKDSQPGGRELQETGGLESAKSDIPPVSVPVEKPGIDTPDFKEGTDAPGSLGRYAVKKSETDLKRKISERQSADEKEVSEKARLASIEVFKARLATAEINRASLIENRTPPVQPGAENSANPANASDVALMDSLIKRADAEIDLCKRELRRLEESAHK